MKKVIYLAAFIMTLLLPTAAFAASTSAALSELQLAEVIRSANPVAYDAPYGKDEFPEEYIEPAAGSLSLKEKILHLPGKNGLDVDLSVSYNNQEYEDNFCLLETLSEETFAYPAYYYTYTINGKTKTALVYFGTMGEEEMLEKAPLSFTTNALPTIQKDDYNTSYYKYYAFKEATATSSIEFVREKEMKPKFLYFDRRMKLESTDINARRLYFVDMWKWDIPSMAARVMAHVSYDDGTYRDYEGVNSFTDIDGEVYPVTFFYEETRKTHEIDCQKLEVEGTDGKFTGWYDKPKENTVDEERGITYRCTITDSEGRTSYITQAGRVAAVEDRFGNIIKYSYDEKGKLSKIEDTLGRIVSIVYDGDETRVYVDPDGNGGEEPVLTAKFITTHTNNSEYDPNDLLTRDNVYKCSIIRYENGEKEQKKDFVYNIRTIMFNKKSAVGGYAYPQYNVLKVYHPNGIETDYEYISVKKFGLCDRWDGSVSVRSDKDGADVFNKYSYSYDRINNQTVKTKEQGDTETYYLNDNCDTVDKKTVGDSTSYTEEYEYASIGKRKLRGVNAKYKQSSYNSIGLQKSIKYNKMRYAGVKYDDREETITYFGDSRFKASEEYNIDENTRGKTEYILSDEGADFYKGRTVAAAIVSESTDNGKSYTEKYRISYEYNADGTLKSEIKTGDGKESSVSYAYDYLPDGGIRVTKTTGDIKNAEGLSEGKTVTVQTMDYKGNLISSVDGNGNETTYEYDGLGRLIRKINPDGSDAEYTYNTAARTVIFKNEADVMEKVKYDGFGNTLAVYKNAGSEMAPTWVKTYENQFDGLCRPVASTTYTGYSGNNPTKWITVSYEYGALDYISQKTTEDEAGNELANETYSYNFASIMNSSAARGSHDYQNNGGKRNFVLVTKTSAAKDGITPPVVKSYYDARNRLCKEIQTDGDKEYITTYTYDAADNVLEMKDARSYAETNTDYTAKYEYNYLGQVTKAYNADGSFKTAEYDAFGNLAAETDFEGNETRYAYDEAGRPVKKSLSIDENTEALTKYYYDKNGNTIKETVKTDDGEREVSYEYDSAGRILSEYNGETYKQYYYNNLGQLDTTLSGTAVKLSDIYEYSSTADTYNVQRYSYDKFGNISSDESYNDWFRYTYDIAGNMLTKKNSKNVTESMTYDSAGRLLTDSIGGDVISYEYNSFGLCTAAERNGKRTEYEYDNFGRAVKETEGGRQLLWNYDTGGNVTRFEIKEGGETVQSADYTYDAVGNMSGVTDGEHSAAYTYNANGLPILEDKGVFKTLYEYNGANMVSRTVNMYENAAGTDWAEWKNVSEFSYTYTADGNVLSFSDKRGNTTYSTLYTYDGVNRLTDAAVQKNGAAERSWSYEYNLMGDMTKKTETVNGTAKVTSYAYKNHLMTGETTDGKSVSYTYDQNGNTLTRTADGVTARYTYSPRNELLTVTEGENTYSYTYNAAGLRTGKTVGGKTTEYIWSGDNIVREEETGKSIDYLYGINRVSRTIKGDNYRGTYYEGSSEKEISVDGYSEYYFCDGRGNVMQMVSSDYSGGITQIAFGVDASKMPELKISEVYDDRDRDINSTDFQTYVINAPVTRSYYYDPYGGQQNEDNGYDTNPFRYAGEQWDRETGSIYLRARFYSPGTGRFMTVDPIKDGENWYAYCAGNPVMFRDPSGLESYVFYLAEWQDEAEAIKDELVSTGISANEIILVPLNSADDLKNGWNGMGIVKDAEENDIEVNIDHVIINTHGSKSDITSSNQLQEDNTWRIAYYDIMRLEDKDVDGNVIILSCSAGDLEQKNYNPASAFSQKVNGALVIACDVNVRRTINGDYAVTNPDGNGWVHYRYDDIYVTTHIPDVSSLFIKYAVNAKY